MTNEELLKTNLKLLSKIQQQERYLLEDASAKNECPVCGHAMNKFEAARITVNEYSFGYAEHAYACIRCEVPLDPAVPLVRMGPSSWFWRRDMKRPWPRDPVKGAP